MICDSAKSLRELLQVSGMGCDRALWWGCSCDTPATHWKKLRKESRQGCGYNLECDRGGVASAPLR